MSNRLPISGEYPADWPEIGDRVRAENDHRCIRCHHRYKTGENGKGQWTPCDEHCTHAGPFGRIFDKGTGEECIWSAEELNQRTARDIVCENPQDPLFAEWRILTVHHLDGNKSNCEWWNLLCLCQRCHLTIQSRVQPETPYFLEHSPWFQPYVAGFYAHKYEGKNLTRAEVMARLDELLAYERLA